jgi:phytoene dehydrogenase-like protein
MSKPYEVVIAGGGHNALIVGCYLAKAGVKTCIVERKEKAGGSVATSELTGPGFKHDVCSVAHALILGNPLMRNDELQLKSKYGLEYKMPERLTAVFFDDGSVLEFYSDLDRTCDSIAKFSTRDAEAYRRFYDQVSRTLDMVVMGMFSVPPGFGVQAALLDQSPEGQEMMRLQSISSWDLISEWFENDKVKIALARYASESMMNPFDNGTGFGFYLILPYMYKYGMGIPVGGSGALADSLVKCFTAHGGEIKLDSEIKQIRMSGQDATGVVLTTGEEIAATKAVVAGLHVAQVFPHMVPGATLPDGFQRRIDTLKYASLQPFTVHLSLEEPVQFKVGESVNDFFWVERSHSNVEQFAQAFRQLEYGYPVRDFAAYVQQYKADPTRLPPGKGMVHIYAFAPLNLKNGGREKWDVIGSEVADQFIDDLSRLTTNVHADNIIGKHFMTPLDIQRYNTSLVNTDIQHIGFYSWQLGGNRPVPGWGQYRTPVNKLYLTAGSTHPGGGVTGGPGRNATQVIMEDLGLDFDSVCG